MAEAMRVQVPLAPSGALTIVMGARAVDQAHVVRQRLVHPGGCRPRTPNRAHFAGRGSTRGLLVWLASLIVLSINTVVTIQRGLRIPPGELPVWGPLALFTTGAAGLLLVDTGSANTGR